MKNLYYLFAKLILFGSLISCEINNVVETDQGERTKSTISNIESMPISVKGIKPFIIPGQNRGGNRTCDEVATAFNTTFALCGNKLDFGDFDFDGDNEFNGEFPVGLEVVVDGNSVSFHIDNYITLDGNKYIIAAVIVKGGNNANVYYYSQGTLNDDGLAAPNGAMISNLTFCYIEAPIVIAIKSWYWTGSSGNWIDYTWAASSGNYVFMNGWSSVLGINFFPVESNFLMHRRYSLTNIVGKVDIVKENDVLVITIDMNDNYLLDISYVYAGTLEGLMNSVDASGIPDYLNWPYKELANENVHILKIPF
jgi:hypothetical protein